MTRSAIKRIVLLTILSVAFTIMPSMRSHAVVWVVIKEALIKAIKAIDLQVQRLQNETIWLQNAQKSLENTMSKLQLDEITDWVSKHREQYAQYFDELRTIKEAIDTYQQVKDIMRKQMQMVKEYSRAFAQFKKSNKFTVAELAYMAEVYNGILNESVKSLDQLFLVIKPNNTQMTDGGRLAIINGVAGQVDESLSDLRLFNNENIKLSLARTKNQADLQTMKAIFGI